MMCLTGTSQSIASRRAKITDRRHGDLALVREVALGQAYGDAASFLATKDYEHFNRWATQMAARPAVKRGRIVNKLSGDPAEQLHERHDASDFELRTQDKLEPVDESGGVRDDAI